MTQVIYIDSLLFVNLFIDYLLLLLIRRILHIHAKHLRIVFGSIFASVTTLGIFLPFYTPPFALFYRIFTAIIIILIAFGFGGIGKLIIRTAFYFGISMAFCGSVFAIEYFLKPQGVTVYSDAVYFDISPTVLLLSTIATYIGLNLLEKLSRKKRTSEIVKVTAYIEDNSKISFEVFVDTGCTLKEPFSGLPVIIAERELWDGISIPRENMRVIPFGTMSEESIIYGFKPLRVYINDKEVSKGCYIGLCSEKLKGEVKSIMGLELLERI